MPVASDRWLFRDEDEWPGTRYERGDEVLHIALRNWADLLIVAPLDANTLAKFALGISDNCLSCVFRAWDFSKPVVLAPAMNTLMWESPVTLRHLGQLLEDRATVSPPVDWTLDEAPMIFARHAPRIVLIPPQAKRLACGDFGTGRDGRRSPRSPRSSVSGPNGLFSTISKLGSRLLLVEPFAAHGRVG